MVSWHKTYQVYRLVLLLVGAISIVSFNILVAIDASAQVQNGNFDVQQILNEHNVIRERENLEPFELNPLLNQSAQAKAEAMLENNCWSHYCPDGVAPWEYIEDEGYLYIVAGENLAEGFFDVDVMMQAWLNSPTHAENILRAEYEDIGIGIVTGNFQGSSNNIIVAIHFGDPIEGAFASDVSQLPEILIQAPFDGDVITQPLLEIEGVALGGIDVVNLQLNDLLQGNTEPENGIFFFRVENVPDDEYIIQVSAQQDPNVSDSIAVEVDSVQQVISSQSNTGETIQVASLSPSTKNAINIGFIFAILALFVIDLLMLRFTTIAQEHTIQSHPTNHHSYHVGIIIVLLVIVASGGIAGSVGPDGIQLVL